MLGDMMGKLQEMQQKSEEVKKRLDSISVEATAEDSKIKVVSNGNKKITSVEISAELMNSDKEQLEDLLLLTVNRALEKADKLAESEMAGIAKGFLPGF